MEYRVGQRVQISRKEYPQSTVDHWGIGEIVEKTTHDYTVYFPQRKERLHVQDFQIESVVSWINPPKEAHA